MKKEQEMKTNLEALAAMTDDDINCSDVEALSDEWLETAEWFAEVPEKELISLRIDRPVLEFYRKTGKGYQTRINAVLRAYAKSAEKRQRNTKQEA